MSFDFQAVREKEKGDWKKMTLEEKKQLYRASFANTLEEITAPYGLWKYLLGALACGIGITSWIYMGLIIHGNKCT